MDVQRSIGGVQDAMTVHRVYGDPVERNGTAMIIPAVAVRGGAGGGEERGSSSGFGIAARPVGAWVITGERVEWKPAIDVSRIVLGGQLVGLAAILVFGRVLHEYIRARERRARDVQ